MKTMLISQVRYFARLEGGVKNWRVIAKKGDKKPTNIKCVTLKGDGVELESGLIIKNNQAVPAERIPKNEKKERS